MRYLTRTELAERWGIHPGTLANWAAWNRGPKSIRDGRRVVYRMADVLDYETEHGINKYNE